jgi:AcrR family transcriptional regulator
MATTKINTRDEIIRIGAQLIHSQGYKATGLQQILDVAGIPKGSFYFYFKSKDDFGCAVIDYFTFTINAIFAGYLCDTRIKPLDRLNNLLDFYESALKKSGTVYLSWSRRRDPAYEGCQKHGSTPDFSQILKHIPGGESKKACMNFPLLKAF